MNTKRYTLLPTLGPGLSVLFMGRSSQPGALRGVLHEADRRAPCRAIRQVCHSHRAAPGETGIAKPRRPDPAHFAWGQARQTLEHEFSGRFIEALAPATLGPHRLVRSPHLDP